ncbi:hypothetical protein G9A89_023000 [Geosiphon pyriformis]|nr:hypothetical protein G9A89_023000 [Geosiphon pyriformis]
MNEYDNGNLLNLTNKTYPPPFYYKGRFSNGPVWPEYLSQRWNASLIDLAFGGAVIDNDVNFTLGYTPKGLVIPGIAQQIDSFLATNLPQQLDITKTLVTTWGAGNDYRDSNFTVSPTKIVTRLASLWPKLYNRGFKNFLVPSLADLSILPEYKSSPTNFFMKAKQDLVEHTEALKTEIQKFKAQYTDAIVYFFEPETFIIRYRKSRAKSDKITNLFDACVTQTKICENPQNFYFWDSIHPTGKIHYRLAEGLGLFAFFEDLEPIKRDINLKKCYFIGHENRENL